MGIKDRKRKEEKRIEPTIQNKHFGRQIGTI